MFTCEKQPCKTLGEGYFIHDVPVSSIVDWQECHAKKKLDKLSEASLVAGDFVCLLVHDQNGNRVFSTAKDAVENLSFRMLNKLKEECFEFCGLGEDVEDQAKN